jgi:uncharacterized protein (UPF0212 family)
MSNFIVIGHAEGEEPVVKIVKAEHENIATERMTAFIENLHPGKDIYIDGVDCQFSATATRLKEESLSSGALFLIAGHNDGDSISWKIVESASLDSAVEIFVNELYKLSENDDVETYVDIEIGLLDLYDDPIIVSEPDANANVSRLGMLSIEVEKNVFDVIKSNFDVFERPDLDNEFIVDFSHLSDPENEHVQTEIAAQLNIDASDVDGYICMYV